MNDHERCLIASILRNHGSIAHITESVRPDMFEDGRNQKLFQLLVTSATTKYAHTVETLTNFLDQSHGDAQKKRDLIQYVISLTGDFSSIDRPELEHAISSLKTGYRRRVMIGGLTTALDSVQKDDLETCEMVFARTLDTLMGVDSARSFHLYTADAVLGNYKRAETLGVVPGIPFGFPKIDGITGGYLPGYLVIWGAYTSECKTRFACRVAQIALALGHRVLFVSLEMQTAYIMALMTCGHAFEMKRQLLEIKRATSGALGDKYPIYEAAAQDLQTRGQLYLWSPGRVTLSDVQRRIASLRLAGHIDLVVIDYLQLVTPEHRRQSGQEEFGEILRESKQIAMREDTTILALHQMSRDGREKAAERGYYEMRAYGTSSEVERNGDICGWNLMTSDHERNSELKMGVAKSRESAKLAEGYMVYAGLAYGVMCERSEMPERDMVDRYLR